MPANPVGDLFRAGTAIAQQFIQRGTEKRNIERQKQANLELADRQYGHNLDMWNRMNEYNAPVKQMERLKEAGLNPHLMYGQGNTGNASTMPQYQEQATDHRVTPLRPLDTLQQYQNLQMSKENLLMARDQNRILNDTYEERVLGIRGEGYAKRSQSNILKAQARKAAVDASTAENLATYNVRSGQAQTQIKEAEAQYALDMAMARYNNLNADTSVKQLNAAYQKLVNAAAKNGRTIESDGMIRGWTDILNGRFETPQAQNVYYAAGRWGLDTLKSFVPFNILSKFAKGGKLVKPRQTGTRSVTYKRDGRTYREVKNIFEKN